MSSNERVIGIIGSGTMGMGIAQAAATAGFIVETLDTDPELINTSYARIRERLDGRVAKGKLSSPERDEIAARLRVATGYDCLENADCIVEAVPEDLALKREVFSKLDPIVRPKTLLATNTSSLSINEIADGLQHADRFLGMHFFNPAPVMKLIELVRGKQTSDQALVDARSVCTKLGKTAVLVTDSPGFIGNRVNRPFYLEALHLLETGEADIPTIDAAVRDVGGFKMGPFELLDLIGLDVNLRVTETVYGGFDRPIRFQPSAIQKKLVGAGHLGRKSGRGFYHHGDGRPTPAYEGRLKDVSHWKASAALSHYAQMVNKPADRATWIQARIFLAVVNEAALVADSIALPRDVNLAMENGFNYPEGPLAAADFIGLDNIQALMTEFAGASSDSRRFAASPLLEKRVAEGNLGEKTARGFLYHAL